MKKSTVKNEHMDLEVKTAEELATERIQSIWAKLTERVSELCAKEAGLELHTKVNKLLSSCLPELKKVPTQLSQELRCEAVNAVRKTERTFGKLLDGDAYRGIDTGAALGSLLTDVAKTLEKELKKLGK